MRTKDWIAVALLVVPSALLADTVYLNGDGRRPFDPRVERGRRQDQLSIHYGDRLAQLVSGR